MGHLILNDHANVVQNTTKKRIFAFDSKDAFRNHLAENSGRSTMKPQLVSGKNMLLGTHMKYIFQRLNNHHVAQVANAKINHGAGNIVHLLLQTIIGAVDQTQQS